MSQEFDDLLARLAPGEKPERLEQASRSLEDLVLQLAATLHGLGDPRARQDILAHVSARTRAFLGDANGEWVRPKLDPDLLEWARSQINEEDILTQLREVQATGGLELKDFIHELEQEATSRE